MVVVYILPHAEFGRNNHPEDAPHFTYGSGSQRTIEYYSKLLNHVSENREILARQKYTDNLAFSTRLIIGIFSSCKDITQSASAGSWLPDPHGCLPYKCSYNCNDDHKVVCLFPMAVVSILHMWNWDQTTIGKTHPTLYGPNT